MRGRVPLMNRWHLCTSLPIQGNGNMFLMYEPKTHRCWVRAVGLVSVNLAVKETASSIRPWRNLRRKWLKAILKYRASIKGYIGRYPFFIVPIEPPPFSGNAPRVLEKMPWSAGEGKIAPVEEGYVCGDSVH